MKRALAIVGGALIGAAFGLVFGTVAADLVNGARTRMDEADYFAVALLGTLVAPFIGGLIGGVAGARVERCP